MGSINALEAPPLTNNPGPLAKPGALEPLQPLLHLGGLLLLGLSLSLLTTGGNVGSLSILGEVLLMHFNILPACTRYEGHFWLREMVA